MSDRSPVYNDLISFAQYIISNCKSSFRLLNVMSSIQQQQESSPLHCLCQDNVTKAIRQKRERMKLRHRKQTNTNQLLDLIFLLFSKSFCSIKHVIIELEVVQNKANTHSDLLTVQSYHRRWRTQLKGLIYSHKYIYTRLPDYINEVFRW